ncbi:hypothetical protein [Halorubrum ezzemoulense]|uniref:hypothetical protein n=1 Tax=Halorubrum ezzemoulense TaxID=337243 RepID=UPI0011407862|nr:hypothetical protein [Halorubrum ezzemoulense]
MSNSEPHLTGLVESISTQNSDKIDTDAHGRNSVHMESGSLDSTTYLVLVSLCIVLGIPGIVLLISTHTNLQFNEVTNLTSSVGSILLSAVLAYLYFQMWETQEERTLVQQNQEEILEKQADIQEKQHEIRQTEKKALLDILQRDIQDDDCRLQISNHGAGAVVELYIATELGGTSDGFSGGQKNTQLRRGDSSTGGKIVGPNEKGVQMNCCPQFEATVDENTIEGDFSTITTSLKRMGLDRIKVRIGLVAVDEFGNPTEKSLLNEDIAIHQNMELDEIGNWKNN